jgi:hypothetical protein
MDAPLWQTITALACVAIAAGALLWRVVRLFRGGGKTGCGSGCNSCPVHNDKAPDGFVPLSRIMNHERHEKQS